MTQRTRPLRSSPGGRFPASSFRETLSRFSTTMCGKRPLLYGRATSQAPLKYWTTSMQESAIYSPGTRQPSTLLELSCHIRRKREARRGASEYQAHQGAHVAWAALLLLAGALLGLVLIPAHGRLSADAIPRFVLDQPVRVLLLRRAQGEGLALRGARRLAAGQGSSPSRVPEAVAHRARADAAAR